MSTATYASDRHVGTKATAEELLYQWSDDLGTGGAAPVELAAAIRATGSATARFRVRLGGTVDATDGTLVAEINTTNAAWTERSTSATVTLTAGQQLIKVTGLISSAGQEAQIDGVVVTVGRANDGVGPQLVNFNPPPGVIPGSHDVAAATHIQFDAIDVTPDMAQVELWVQLPDRTESLVIHDGTNFRAPFSSGSARTAITNGYHFDVFLPGGWPSGSMEFEIKAYDAAGNRV